MSVNNINRPKALDVNNQDKGATAQLNEHTKYDIQITQRTVPQEASQEALCQENQAKTDVSNQSRSRITYEAIIRIQQQRVNRRLFTYKRENDDASGNECKRFKEF